MTDLIERQLVLDADPATVWRAMTDPVRLQRWLGDVLELDLRPGGAARFVVDGDERSGWVEEVSAPHRGRGGRLTLWWQAGDEPASRVALEVDAVNGGTRLRVVEARPLDVLDLTGIPMPGAGGHGVPSTGPVLVAA